MSHSPLKEKWGIFCQEQIYERLTGGRLKPPVSVIGTDDPFTQNASSVYLKRIICLP